MKKQFFRFSKKRERNGRSWNAPFLILWNKKAKVNPSSFSKMKYCKWKKNLFDFFKKDFSKVVHFFVEEVDFYKKISFVFSWVQKKTIFPFIQKNSKENQLFKTEKRIL